MLRSSLLGFYGICGPGSLGVGDFIAEYSEGIKGDTRSLDPGSLNCISAHGDLIMFI